MLLKMNLVLVQYSISKHDTREGKKTKMKINRPTLGKFLTILLPKKYTINCEYNL